MNHRYHAELAWLDFPIPAVTRYTVRCRWRPTRVHWKLKGGQWREVTVVIDCN